MSTCTEINLLNVPEKFILSLLESYFNRYDSHKTITTNTLLVGKGFENYFTGGNEKWISVEFLVPTNSRDGNSVISRPLHVIYLPYLTSEIIISENDLFNLLKTELPASEVPYVKSVCELTFNKVYDKMPLKAKTVKLCLLNNVVNVESDIIDTVLLNYFKCKRFLFKGDVFGVDVSKYLPELQYAKGYHNLSTIYFKVCEIDVSLISNEPFNATDFINGYIVDDTVALYQLSTQNSFLPSVSYLVSDHESSTVQQLIIKDFLKPLLPPYLEVYADKLIDLFRPFMIYKLEELQLKPLFVLNGPIGCGKSLILKNIAKKLGLQYVRVECSSLTVGPAGFNEGKLRATFARVKKCLPCLLQFSNFEALTEDREGNDDGHIVSCFNKLLIGMKNDLPFVVVGTTSSSDKFSCELLQNILQIINIENPSVSDRAGTISWLCQIPQSTVLKVAERTSGFTFSDLTFLVTETYREKYKRKYGNDNDCKNNELEFEDLVTIIDRMNAQTASAIGAPQVPTVGWSDVGGHNEIKREIVRSLSTADFGTGLRRSGILLWGPPGTGKTLLAKAVATECKSTFLSVKGPELLNMYVGQSEQNVREVFERARDAAPCIIFFDELDSLAPNRGKSDSAGVMDRVVSQLLSEMDGLQKNEGVFVLGATNRPDLIDPALLRPGRLDKMLYVGPCEGTESKLSVLKALTRKFKMNDDVDLHLIAELLPPSLTGADLYSVCYNAWQNAARNVIRQMNLNNSESAGTVVVSADDFDFAVKDLLTSEN